MPWPWCNLAETTLAWPSQSRGQVQQKPNLVKVHVVKAERKGNPVQWNWQKAQHAGNQDSKNKLGRKLTQLSLRFQKTSSYDRRSSPLRLEGYMANKILIPLQFFISCFLETPVNRQAAVGATEGLWQGLPRVSWRLRYLLCPINCCPSGWGFLCP